MMVYIKTSQDGISETETEYAALQGFTELGCKIVFSIMKLNYLIGENGTTSFKYRKKLFKQC